MKTILVFLAAALAPILPSVATESRGVQNPTGPARTPEYLYRRHCSSCHGVDGQSNTSKGKLNHSRNLADPAWQDEVSDERIFNSIMNGRNVRGNMPPFNKRITEAEGDSLVTFVRNLKK
jgi:mono/diheme cytochrome c family protein